MLPTGPWFEGLRNGSFDVAIEGNCQSVINPLLDARIEWRWFIVCQIAFGAVAGFVVNLTERVRTMQHLPFAVRTGIEAPGLTEKRD